MDTLMIYIKKNSKYYLKVILINIANKLVIIARTVMNNRRNRNF